MQLKAITVCGKISSVWLNGNGGRKAGINNELTKAIIAESNVRSLKPKGVTFFILHPYINFDISTRYPLENI